jgi:hypothetical protein
VEEVRTYYTDYLTFVRKKIRMCAMIEYCPGKAPGWAEFEKKTADRILQLQSDGFKQEIIIQAQDMGDMSLHDKMETRLRQLKGEKNRFELITNVSGDEVLFVL